MKQNRIGRGKKLLMAVLVLALLLSAGGQAFAEDAPAAKNGEVIILYTSDIHCGVDEGFGLVGLRQIRQTLEDQGYTTILVDNGDSVQGEPIGTLSKGETIIDLMNDMDYTVGIPGNHDFDYGMDQFFALVDEANFPFICCNFTKNGERVFEPYLIKEVCGMKIAFVGVTTPKTLSESTPKYFQDENGNYIYGFMQDETGEAVYEAVQKAVDDARAEGADYVYVMGHLGMFETDRPWTYADVIANTRGIDVFLDGHSHDTEQVVMKNRDGEDVTRSAVGTKLNCIGHSRITADGIQETGIWSWPNTDTAPELFSIDNEMSGEIQKAEETLDATLKKVVAHTNVELTIYDPVAKDNSGNPIRMVRRAETNLGDLCADAYRDQCGADIGIANGGAVRASIGKGDITYGDILTVHPFGNMLCMVEATGQQILDALEWGSRMAPDECGGFLQVSGLSYEIHCSIPSSCKADEKGICVSIGDERRVQNVKVGDEPIDPGKTYTVASIDYILKNHGDGQTAFDGATLLQDSVKLDNQALIDYITGTLGGEVGSEYVNPTGQGRIVVVEKEP